VYTVNENEIAETAPDSATNTARLMAKKNPALIGIPALPILGARCTSYWFLAGFKTVGMFSSFVGLGIGS